MSKHFSIVLALYMSLVASSLAIVISKGNSYENQALRLDLKVMTLELKGQSSVIDRMGRLRNAVRAKAEVFQTSALLLAIAVTVLAPALSTLNPAIFFLVAVSFIASAYAYYLAISAYLGLPIL